MIQQLHVTSTNNVNNGLLLITAVVRTGSANCGSAVLLYQVTGNNDRN